MDQIKKPSQSEEKRAEELLPDVKQSATELVIDQISSLDLGNAETNRDHFRRCYNCVTAQLCSHLVIFLKKNTQITKKLKMNIFKTYFLSTECLNNLPCIQNWKNPALLCHL